MVVAAPTQHKIVAVLPRGTPDWLRGIVGDHGFETASSPKSLLKRATRDPLPDCILGIPSVRVLSMFESLREAMPLPRRPLLVLLSEVVKPVSVADYVFAPDPDALMHNLNAALSMRAQWLALVHQGETRVTPSEYERLIAEQTRLAAELHLLKTTVINNVAHELNTPIMQLKGALTLMGNEAYIDEYDDMYEFATISAARLEELIGNIRMLAGAFRELEFEPVYLPDCLSSALHHLRRSWAVGDQTDRVTLLPHDRLPPVRGNGRAVAVVLQLLIDNALKFSTEPVEVEMRVHPEHVQITVRDRGIGIPDDQLDAIFESFYQVDGSSTRRHPGMGVGLAIARQVVENHGGRIIVNSTPNAGSEFHFTLPVWFPA